MNFILRPIEKLLYGLNLERKVLALLGLCTGLVMLVSSVLVAWAVLSYYAVTVDSNLRAVQSELTTALARQSSQDQAIVNTLARDPGLIQGLDEIARLYRGRNIDAPVVVAKQGAIAQRLAQMGMSARGLLVAYDRDGEALAYFDSRSEPFAQGVFPSPLLSSLSSGVARPSQESILRAEIALPSSAKGWVWRIVTDRLSLVSTASVVAGAVDKRSGVGSVGFFGSQVSETVRDTAARNGYDANWQLPGAVKSSAQDAVVLSSAPLLTAQTESASSQGIFDSAGQYGRVFSIALTSAQGEGAGRLILTHKKSPLQLHALLVFLSVMVVPLLACALAVVPCLRLARSQVVQPMVRLSKEIDAVRDGSYVPDAVVDAQDRDEIAHGHRILGELANALSEREREAGVWMSVFRKTREAIFVTDLDGNVAYVNQAFSEVSGTTEEQALHQPASFLRSGLHDEAFYEEMWLALREDGHWSGEVWDQKQDGTTYPQWLSMSAVTDRKGRVTNYAGIFSDISERKAQEEHIKYLAHHDALTKLPNRILLMERLRIALLHAEREGHMVAVLFIDLDRFKIINDTLGHSVGDGLLQTVAERLKRAVRASDTVSRLGGDEFIVLLYKMRAIEDAQRVAEHILAVMAPTARVEGHELAITPSIGVAAYPDNGLDAEELIRNADVAMYHAKSQGRNNYQLFEPALSETAVESLSLEHALRCALDRDEFTLYYQPQIEVATRKLVGVEALIRWKNDEFGMVPTSKFIRIAEECGLILQLGDWVLREACRQRAEWNADGVTSFPVAVNVSALQFRQPEFVRRVEESMQLYGIKADQLELELTESIVMHESGVTANALETLKGMGISLAIDDFGTGYSSLGYLKHLPIQKLKIDGSFMRGIETNKADLAIVEAIVSLGRALDLTLVAEGVEQRSTITLLGKLGCHVAQGFYYCRPLPPKDFVAWHREFSGEGKRMSLA